MRSELEQIERIESYILGELDEKQKQLFENDLKIDSSLRENYNLQLQIMEGIEHAGLTQVATAAYGKWKFFRALKITSLFTGITAVGIFSFFYFGSEENNSPVVNTPETKNEIALKETKTEEIIAPVADEAIVMNETNEPVSIIKKRNTS